MARKVLFAANNFWTSPFQVGTHELAKQFLKNNWEVAYISDPVSPLHLFSKDKNQIKERFKIWKIGGIKSTPLWAYVPFSILSPANLPILKQKFIFNNWYKFSIPNCITKVKNEGFESVDLLYIDSVYQSFWLKEIKYKKTIFRIADDNLGFSRYKKDTVSEIENEISSKVDYVVYSAETLSEKIKNLNPNSYFYLPNGVDYTHFANGKSKLPTEFESIPEPRVIYLGAIEKWFDFDLINFACERLPKYNFILIGNPTLAREKLFKRPNLFILGTRPYKDIPNYLHYSNIGIIPFDRINNKILVDSINPLKLLQYFACGLPTLSARWKQLEIMNSPVEMYNTHEQFIKKLEDLYNSNIDINKLKSFAQQNDWSNRYNEIIKNLGL
ncbi:putative teichuronic acid biosynthesis glycosyltransferase TuaH [bacterium BMS3Abin04]|nr:putative teichuronic acid biosynthesis glycosyltransferase TuaH [bacterium BMS3Abin04]